MWQVELGWATVTILFIPGATRVAGRLFLQSPARHSGYTLLQQNAHVHTYRPASTRARKWRFMSRLLQGHCKQTSMGSSVCTRGHPKVTARRTFYKWMWICARRSASHSILQTKSLFVASCLTENVFWLYNFCTVWTAAESLTFPRFLIVSLNFLIALQWELG